MKKEYIKPIVNVYDVEVESLMAASDPGSVSFDNGGNGSGVLNDGNATGPSLGKGHTFSVWGYDEEE